MESEESITRREFIKIAAALGASIGVVGFVEGLKSKFPPYRFLVPVLNRSAEERYAGIINYDHFVRSTCAGNCTQACGWNAYVRGKTILGLLQAADYDIHDPKYGRLYNPRGCMRGASYIKYIYGPMRIRYPYKRVGKRGEGKFKRITWDEALKDVASKILDLIQKYGADSIIFFSPIPAYNYVSAGAGYRFANVLGAAGPLSFYDWYCDLPPGEPMVWATQTEESEELDWTYAKLIILWGSNTAESRIAGAKFINIAKYRGAKIYCITTDFNATAKMADVFISVKPGTDAALANAVAKYLIDNNLVDEDFLITYTDMPFLVRADNGKFLTEYDLKEGGSRYKLYVWDGIRGSPMIAPGSLGDERESLDWDKYGIKPVLDGAWEVRLRDGSKVEVKTVFRLLKERLSDKTLEWASNITGVPVKQIRMLAEDLAKIKPVTIIEGGGTNHWYNNDINNRSMILLLNLTGNIGRNGASFNQYTGQYKVWLKGLGKYGRILKSRPLNTTLFVWVHYYTELWRLGRTLEEIVKDIEEGKIKELPGPLPDYKEPVSPDPSDERGYKNYLLIKSLANGWMPIYPKPPKRPHAMFIWRGNFLNQAKGGFKVIEWFKDESLLDLIVSIDFRLSTTGLFADYILPAATWYEKFDIETTPMHIYLQAQNEVINPLYEAKHDFYIFKDICKAVQEEAKRRGGVEWYDEKYGISRDYTKIYDDWVDSEGKENPYFKAIAREGCLETPDMAVHFILKNSPVIYPDPEKYYENRELFSDELRSLIENILFKGDIDKYVEGIIELIRKHPIPFPAVQSVHRPLVPWKDNVEMKIPWPAGGLLMKETINIPGTDLKVPKLLIMKYLGVIPSTGSSKGITKTLTGRQQFYIDHNYFLISGDELPIYKESRSDPLPDGSPAPLKLNTPHERWGTHSTFRDLDLLLRLQRYKAVVSISKKDAGTRGIKDGDIVRVFNKYGELIAIARVVPGVKPGEVWIANGAEMTTFIKGWFNSVTPIRPKHTQSIKYPDDPNPPGNHLRYGWNLWGVTGNECDTSVEVEKVLEGD